MCHHRESRIFNANKPIKGFKVFMQKDWMKKHNKVESVYVDCIHDIGIPLDKQNIKTSKGLFNQPGYYCFKAKKDAEVLLQYLCNTSYVIAKCTIPVGEKYRYGDFNANGHAILRSLRASSIVIDKICSASKLRVPLPSKKRVS